MEFAPIITLILILTLTGCASNGHYPVWEPETYSIGITDQSLIEADSRNHAGRFGNIGMTVSATWRAHPTPTQPIGPYALAPRPTPMPPFVKPTPPSD